MKVTESVNFYQGLDPFDIISEYGSPAYVYNERILRERCREIKTLSSYAGYIPNYSAKSNGNLTLLKIIKSEGFCVDAVSCGEIFACLAAGFDASDIFYITNNASADEFRYALDKGALISADSLSQLELIGEISPGAKVSVRFNPGVGDGHGEKVITGGKKTKFGVNAEDAKTVADIARKRGMEIIGVNQHIGSLFMDAGKYFEGANALLDIARQFPSVKMIDFGGGFGIPYKKQSGEQRMDLEALSENLEKVIWKFNTELGRQLQFRVEPGRYISAECGVLLGTVNAVKENGGKKYIGSDLGFTTLIRPTLYDSHHDVEIYKKGSELSSGSELAHIVGNICESGDYIAKDREIPRRVAVGDIVAALDAGAYGYAMASNYNLRARPAEVLVRPSGETVLIRRGDTFEDMIANCVNVDILR
ncbi:MAG: diaminopimelate decarboxylase [Clostridiales bacterium]|nr:diaminopimelate decarboxylase [Clostridiales bacterium]